MLTTPTMAPRALDSDFHQAANRCTELRQDAVGAQDYLLACFWRDTGAYLKDWYFELMLT